MENENNSLDGNLQRPDQNLETPQANLGPSSGSGFGHRRISPFGFDRLAFAITAVAVLVVVSISLVTYFLINSSSKKTNEDTPKADKYSVSSLPSGTVQSGSQLRIGNVDKLAINGQLQVSNGLVISPTATPTKATAGQIYYDKATNTPYYYNGTKFMPLSTTIQGISGAVSVGSGINLINSTLVNSGVISVQGQSGDVNFSPGSGIAINGTTINNTGVLGISGNPNQLAITSGPDGSVQVQIVGIQDGGVLVGRSGGGIDSVLPTSGGQCLVSDPTTHLPVFGSCTGQSTITSITVGGTALTDAVVIQGAGGINVTNSGQTITIDGSSIAGGTGDVSFGATHTSGHITSLDGSGNLVSSPLIDQTSGLQVQSASYYVDLANSGASTLTIKNSTGSNVANLTVTGVVQANGGIKDSNGNLYSFATTPSGSSRTLCYVDNLNASNCPTGGNVSKSGTQTTNKLTKFDSSGNIQDSSLLDQTTGLQVAGSSYYLDLANSGTSTYTIKNSNGSNVANLQVTGTIGAAGFVQGTDLYTLPANGGNGGVLCYVYNGGSNCPTGGNVSFGTTHTANHVTALDGSGNLVSTDLINQSGGLQVTGNAYYLDVANAGVSTLTVKNSTAGQVANLAVTGAITASGSITASGGLVAHTLSDSSGSPLQITSTGQNIVFSINGGAATFTFPTTGGTGQTICTTGISCASGGGQAVILEPGAAQTSNAATPSIFINRTGGAGNIIQLQAGGSDAFVVDSAGAASIPLASGLTIGKASTNTGKISFKASGNTNTVNLTVANATSGYTLTLPSAAGASGECLGTTGGGILAFVPCLSGSGSSGGVTQINDGTNSASGAVTFQSTDSSVNFTITGSTIDFSVPAGATGVTAVGPLNGTLPKSADGAQIAGSSLYLQTADQFFAGLVSTTNQSFAGNKTFTGTVTVQGGGLTLGNGSTAGSLALVSAGSGSNVTISSANQAAARALTIPTITADDEICLKTKANCASTGSNFIVNGTAQQTTANFNIQSASGQVAAKIQGASGQDIIEFFGSGSASTVLAKIDASGNFSAANGNFSGPLVAAGVNSGSGLIQGTGGLTIAGTITLSSLNTAGILHTNASGIVSTGDVVLGSETSGNYVGSIGSVTGLTLGGTNGAEGSVPTLSVNYGSGANQAVQGNTALVCPSGAGNLTGGGTSITLGTGGTCAALDLISSPTISGNVIVQGGTMSLGVNGTSSGVLKLGNATASSQFVSLQADSRTNAATITIPSGSQTTDEVCLKTLANCTTTGGSSNYIVNGTGQQTSANFNIQSVASQVAAKIQGASGQDIVQFFGSSSSSTVLAKIDANGNLTAVGGAFTGNVSQSGAFTFTTGTGAVALNGDTTVAATKIVSVLSGDLRLGVNGTSTGQLKLGNATASSQFVTLQADSRSVAATITIPTGTTNDTVCLVTLGNCTGTNSGSGNGNYIINGTGAQAANFNIAASGGIAAVVQGAASTDIVNFNKSDTTTALKVASSGLVTASYGLTVTNGATLNGLVQINPSSNANTTINSGTSTGTVSIGGASAGAISLTNASSGISLTSTGNLNFSGSSAIFKNASNSTTAFQIQNSNANALLVADTSNMEIDLYSGLYLKGIGQPSPTLTGTGTGGTLAAGTYYYRVSAYNANSLSGAVNTTPASRTTTGSTSQNTISWSAVPGATGYYLYRATAVGGPYYRVNANNVTSAIDNGTNYTFSGTDYSGDAGYNGTASITLAQGGGLYLDPSGNGSIFENQSANVLNIGAYGSGQGVAVQGDSFHFQNTVDYTDNFTVTNTGQVTIQNRVDQSDAFQVMNHAGTQQLFVVDTLHGRVGVNLAVGSDPAVDFEVNGVARAGVIQGTTNIQLATGSLNTGFFSKSSTIGTGGVSGGDVVILAPDAGNGGAVRAMKTTTAWDNRVYGVATATTANGTNVAIAISGAISVNAVGAIAIGDQLVTSTTAGAVMADNNATTGILGIATSIQAGGSGTVTVNIRTVNGQYAPTFRNAANSANAFQVQNAGGTNIFNVNTSTPGISTSGTLSVGTSGTAGKLILTTPTAGNSVTIQSAAQSASVVLTIPTMGAADTICLLTLANCSGSANTLQSTYTASTGGTTPEIILDATRNGIDIQNSNTTPVTGSLFAIRDKTASGLGSAMFSVSDTGATLLKNSSNSATAFQLQNTSSSTVFDVDTANGRVGVGTNAPNATLHVVGTTPSAIGTTADNVLTVVGGNGSANGAFSAGTGASGSITLGNGGNNTGSTFGGGGGSFAIQGGNGGSVDTSANGFAGVGGSISLTAGNGGNYGITGASGGNINLQAGAAGTLAGSGGTAGKVTINSNGTGILTVGSSTQIGTAMASFSGSVAVKIGATAAFQVQNASGTNLLTADTTALRVSVGSKGTATGQLYVSGNTPSGALGSANGTAASYGLAIQGRYAFTTPIGATNGFQVYDISNPASPSLLTSVNTTATGNKRIKIQGKYAYVTGWVSSTNGTLQIFDISNPKVPVPVGSVTYTAGNNTPALYVQGRYAYVGDSGTPTLYAFDVSNPATPILAGSVAVATTSNGPADISVQGRYAYIVNGGTARFQIIDISNPVSMSLVNSGTQFSSTNIVQVPVSVAVQGRYAYVGTTVGGSTYVIDVSDPTIPTPSSAIVTSVSQSGVGSSLAVQGRYLYEGDATNGLIRTFDISTPTSMSLLSGTTTAASPLALVADGRYLYAANNSSTSTLQSFDMGGAYTQQLEAGGITADTVNVRGNANFSSDASVQGGLTVGAGIQVAGNSGLSGQLAVYGSGDGTNVGALFKNSTNSNTAFQIQNAAGTALFNADTTNLGIKIGTNSINVSFGSKVDSTVGAGPYDVATGDFNGDNKLDAITANFGANNATVVLNNGSGLASSGTNLTTAQGSWSTATGDFNGDGKTDAIVLNNNAVTSNVFLNNGSGISSSTTFTPDTGPTGVTTGDINKDGYSDAIVISGSSTTLKTYLGSATGLATTHTQSIATGASPQAVVAGDFNNDGKVDVAVANGSVTSVFMYLNTGTALSTSPSTLNVGAGPIHMAIGDFNGDGIKNDLAVLNKTDNTVSLFYNTGSGLPASASKTINAGSNSYGLAAADFNGDGITDLVVPVYGASGTGTTATVIISPAATTPTQITLTTGTGPLAATTGDFNGDGKTDIAITTYTSSAGTKLSVFLNSSILASLSVVGTQQISVNSSSALQVKNGAGTSILNVDTANAVLTLNGSAVFTNQTNSTTAFQIQNSTGNTLFNTDTINSVISLGGGGGETSMWQSATNQPAVVRSSGGTVTYNGYAYIVAGENATVPVNSILFSKLNSDGSTGAWKCQGTTATSSCGASTIVNANALPAAVSDLSVQIVNGYIYAVGGMNSSSVAQTGVYHAKINSDGSTGAWSASGVDTSLPLARGDAQSVVYNGTIYIMGGAGSGDLASIYYATPDPATGKITGWNTNTYDMPDTLVGGTAAAYNGKIYVYGGLAASGVTPNKNVWYNTFNSDGSLPNSWTTQTNALPAAKYQGTGLVANGNLYAIGGQTTSTGSTATGTVFYAKIGSNGVPASTWSTSANGLPSSNVRAWTGQQTFVNNGYIYVLGGINAGGTVQQSVYYASTQRTQVNGALDLVGSNPTSDGSTGISLTAGNTSIMGNLSVQGVTSLGGSTQIATDSTTAFQVQNSSSQNLFNVDTINGTVTVGNNLTGATRAWTSQSTNLLPQARDSHATTTYNGYIYIIGGSKNGSSISTVMYSKVNADGSTGAWSCQGQNSNSALPTYCGTSPTNSNTLPGARSDLGAVAYGGYLYTFGGYDGTNYLNNVYVAKINADGSTGAWQDKTSTYGLPVALSDGAVVAYNGYVYIVGGHPSGGGSGLPDAYFAKLGSGGTIGTWTTQAGWIGGGGTNRRDMGAVVANGYLYALGGNNGATNPYVYYGKINSDGTLTSASQQSAVSLPVGMSGGTIFTSNGYLYIAGYYNGGSAGNVVMSAKINSDGSIGSWSCQGASSGACGGTTPVNSNALPAERSYAGLTGVTLNGYMYVIGGTNGNGSNYSTTTVYYTSAQRLAVNASLDLVGGFAGSEGDGGASSGSSGGSLTAGNTRILGTLDVQSSANFAQDVTILGDLNVSGNFSLNGTLQVVTGNFSSGVADGVSAKAFTFNSAVTYSTTGSLLLSVQNNGTQVFGIDYAGHYVTSGTAPGHTAGSAAGTGATCDLDGTDVAGTVTVHVKSGAGTGILCTITFAKAYFHTPHVLITSQGNYAAQISPDVDNVVTGSFDIRTPYPPSPVNQDYIFNYFVIESR